MTNVPFGMVWMSLNQYDIRHIEKGPLAIEPDDLLASEFVARMAKFVSSCCNSLRGAESWGECC
jgi:hypothetical protein